MSGKTKGKAPGSNGNFGRLLEVCRQLSFEPHDIARQLDHRGRYQVELNREFPFLIKLFHYSSQQHTRGPTWHERLELFLPLDGATRFRMGDTETELGPGDLLVVDNFKLHHVVDFPGFDTRAIVVSFMPEFVYSLGSPSHDYMFLLPFYPGSEKAPRVMRRDDAASVSVYGAMADLLRQFFSPKHEKLRQAGCKAFVLALLYHLSEHCSSSRISQWEFVREQQRALRLKPLFEHISRHFSHKLSVSDAAHLVHMSQPQFMKTFKKVAGTTLVAYLNHVRLSSAARLLNETALTIAEIASEVGFSDQSYFDKQFKRAFGCSPKQFRRN
ncbi:MAG TPA: AraC family transcriptional regulator [Verrucomicrobiae bacterium]|nr:AraC family transcriptional regulator [Verrucomicrobiae bacterium]